MKKYLISLVICTIVISYITVSVCAADFQYLKFGGQVVNPTTLDGVIANNFTCHNSGNYSTLITTAEKHTGKKSFCIQCDSSTGQILFESSTLAQTNLDTVVQNNALLLELYIKGFDIKSDTLSFYKLFFDAEHNIISVPNSGAITCEAADENGWHRVWCVVPPNDYSTIRFGISYNGDDGDDGLTSIYIDDITARLMPVKIKISNAVCNNESMPLDILRVKAYNADNQCEIIATNDLIKYSIQSGDGYIDENNNLIYTGSDTSNNVCLKADFLGITTTFSITFIKSIHIEEVTCENGVYTTNVTNMGSKDVVVSLIVCIYNGERLSLTKTFSQTVPANSSAAITSSKIEIPFYVNNPVIKTFVRENS